MDISGSIPWVGIHPPSPITRPDIRIPPFPVLIPFDCQEPLIHRPQVIACESLTPVDKVPLVSTTSTSTALMIPVPEYSVSAKARGVKWQIRFAVGEV
jgi:hypothetical protein